MFVGSMRTGDCLMNRLFAAALATVLVAGALAQGTFTIRRPVDGSKVRETVKVRIPKNSIPEGGYIGILVNGKFLEAVVPDVEGDDYVYNLNTKERKLADGPMTVEAVLYFYTQGAPMVLNRSSVNVTLDNSASLINTNPDGFSLRYRFTPGREYTYNRSQQSVVSIVSQAQAQLGSRAAEIASPPINVRYLIAHHNNYGNEGLIRIQALPEKGKDYAWLNVVGATEPQRYRDFEMHPIFMRITNTGREVFTSLPTFFPWEGGSVDARTDLFALFPPPILPSRKVAVGDSWQAAIPIPQLELEKQHEQDKYILNQVARGTLEAVEWEQGIPCAKIRTELSLGADDLKGLGSLDGVEGETQNLKIESIQWFALDRGILIREELRQTSEQLVEVGGSGGAGGGAGRGDGGSEGVAPGGGRRGGGGAPGSDFEGSVRPGSINAFTMGGPSFAVSQRLFQVGLGSGPTTTGGQGGGAAGFGQEGAGGAAGGGGSVGVKMILRQQSRVITILER